MKTDNKPYLIAETAFHHEGDKDYLIALVDAAVELEVDTIKFHLLLDLDDYFASDHAAYQPLKDLMIEPSFWPSLHDYVNGKGIRPLYLCNDVASLEWVNTLPKDSIEAIEIHATGINDVFLLSESSKFSSTVILGTGGSTMDEIHFAVKFLRDLGKEDIMLMHGFQNYPTDYKDILFSKMNLLKNTFRLPVGYADHTDPLDPMNEVVSCLPFCNGFNILEKHFTINFGEKRVDAQAAVSLEQMKKIKSLMLSFSKMYGSDSLAMSEAELKYGNTGPMKKAIVAAHDIEEGQIISIEDIRFKRTNDSSPLRQIDLSKVLGGTSSEKILKDTIISFHNVDYTFRKSSIDQFIINKD